MENSNEIRLKKIPLLVLLEALKDIYERGVDYVDIIGVPGVEQDSIGIAIRSEDRKSTRLNSSHSSVSRMPSSA